MTQQPLTKASTTATPPVKHSGKSRLLLWINKLPKHKLGFNPSLAQAIKVEINDLESTSERLANLIQQDPALSLNLYQHTQGKVLKKEGDIQSLVHMIGLIGLRHIETTLTPMPSSLHLGVKQKALYAASMFAAELAKQLMPLKHGTVGERFFLPALFFNAPLWKMWQAAPKVMSVVHESISEKQMPPAQVFRARLGFQLIHLLKRSTHYLRLPEQTHKALAIDMRENLSLWATMLHLTAKKRAHWLENNKSARHFFYSTELGIYLINHYVLALYFDFSGKQIKRFSRLLCAHLGIEQDELSSLVSKTALAIKLPALFGEEASPQFRLRGLHRGDDVPLDDRSTKTLSSVHTNPLALLKNAKSIKDALNLTHKSLMNGTSATQCFIFKRDPDQEQSLYMAYDKGLAEGAESLMLNTSLCGQFFKKLLEKPIALYISASKLPKIEKQLPRPLMRFWSPQTFSIMSVYYDNQPLAIVVCSSRNWDEKEHEHFKKIGKLLNKRLQLCTH